MLASPGLRLDRVGRLYPLCGVLALTSGAVAAAEPLPTPPPVAGTEVRLELDAPPECARRDELVARVAARSSRIRFVAESRVATVLRVAIGAGAHGGFVAELDVAEPDGRRFARRIEAGSCTQATDALALVIAITFDPMYAATTAESPAADAPTPPTSAPVPSAPPPPPVAPPPVERAGTDLGREPPRLPTVQRGTLGAGGEIVWGPAPGPLYGFALTAAYTMDRHSLLSPAVSASFAHLWADPFTEQGGIATFSLDAGTLDLCPLRFLVPPLGVAACATGAYGRLSARGTETYSPQVASRPLATAGGAMLLTVDLGTRFEVRGRFGAGASLVRDSFEFTPDVFHRTASVTLVGDLGVGVRFP
jgi:hypothetical protein